MQVACKVASWHCAVLVKLCSLFCESEGWWFKSPPGQHFHLGCFSLHPAVAWYFATLFIPRMAPIYPPNAQNSECQIFYFLTFSAERSKFLERTLVWDSLRANPDTFCAYVLKLLACLCMDVHLWRGLRDFNFHMWLLQIRSQSSKKTQFCWVLKSIRFFVSKH